MSVLYSTEAVFVASHSNRAGQDTVPCFYFLAIRLLNRLRLFKRPDDAQQCIEYFRYLESRPLRLEAFGVSSDKVNVCLLEVLASQVELGIGDAARSMDEMMDRYRDLLASNIPQPLLKPAITALVRANNVYSDNSLASEYSQILIDHLREANRRLGSHDPYVAMPLAQYLSSRFQEMHSMGDYKEAMALFDKIITSGPIDRPGRHVTNARFHSAMLASMRESIYENPENLEEAISRLRKSLRNPSINDLHRIAITRGLASLTSVRSDRFGTTREGIPETHLPDPGVTSFQHLVESLRARPTIDKTNWWSVPEERVKHLIALETMCPTKDIAGIPDAIEYCHLLLAPTPPSDSIRYFPTYALGRFLFQAFECTDNIEYLNESITTFRNILEMPIATGPRVNVISNLLGVLSVRINLSGDEKDFDETIQLCSMVSKDICVNVPDRLGFSCAWAANARHKGHPTTSKAYESALSLMEDALLFSPTLEVQHHHLVSRRSVYEVLPKNMASYEVSRGDLTHAIEALDRGRALIWSEMRGFRTSVHRLAFAPHLAKELTAVNRELEMLTTSVSPDITMNNNNGHEDGEGMDKFGRLVVRHRKLLAKREELVLQIQALPGLEGFLKKPSFDTLRSAAVGGPVIIVNHSEWRCDILIVLHNTDPSLITTSDDFYDRAIELRDRLVHTRIKYVLESRRYQRVLRFVLESLHELVGRPVIKELQRLEIPPQSRIWWCPTSVFCSLPLHAMGPISSKGGVSRYFSDLYIPSYTPTLSALIESRRPSKTSFEKPSVLLVATPDDSLQDSWPEIWSVQRLNTVTRVRTLLGKRAKASVVLDELQDHQFCHFICHGDLVPEMPFDASFRLYETRHETNRLTLRDIMKSRPPNAEFAFLSACHTAELTEGSIADEGLHLAAAVQYCGFRSVVGTMWAMADQDGGDLTTHFYKSMFSSDEAGVPYHERSARALRDAVRSIRKEKRLPLEQWVNFVHYGA